MLINRKSMWSGREHSMEIDITEEEYNDCLYIWRQGELIIDAFPMLNEEEQEFLLTGMTINELEELS